MLGLLRKAVGAGFTDRQATSLVAAFSAAFVVLLALLIASIAIWLLGLLWTTSLASPFGVWAFVAGVVLSCGLGALTFFMTMRSPVSKPAIRSLTAATVEAMREGTKRIASKPGPADEPRLQPQVQRPKPEQVIPTAQSMKISIQKAFDMADRMQDREELNKAERLNSEYLTKFAAADPGGAAWAQNMSTLIDGLKRRLAP